MQQCMATIAFILLAFASSAQSKKNPLNVSIGGGSQHYVGDLGNSLRNKDFSRGAVVYNVNWYLSRSFDAGVLGSTGDYGFCQPADIAKREVAQSLQCAGCVANGQVGLGNVSARMYSAGLALRYKFANGYLLSEKSGLQPYTFAGIAGNYLSDRMRMDCIAEGYYFSINGGVGVKYRLSGRISVSYQIAGGYFSSDKADFMDHGTNDLYVQQALLLGVDLF